MPAWTAARTWVRAFVAWYNTDHRHSGIGLLPPHVVHDGQADAVTAARQQTLDAAYAAQPTRFVRGHPVPPHVPTAVGINWPSPTAADSPPPATPPAPQADAGSRVSAAHAAP